MATQEHDVRTPTFAELFEAISANIQHVIQGKPEIVDLVVLCLVADGHLLIEDVPGVGKTSVAKALARSVDTSFGRVQFTPDLLPSDVVGVTVWNRQSSTFEFRPGPVFASIVLGDEINRASPKTQSALLESMAEGQVTVDGETYPLGPPFMVIATQNPIEHEGTYPLPESQLDRFLMRLSVGYPGREAETQMLDAHGEGDRLDEIGPVATTAQVHAMINAVRTVEVAEPLQAYLVDLADATRRHGDLALGMSPRATLALQRAIRARAAANGRNFALPDDVKALAQPVLAHRLIATPEAQLRGTTAADALAEILAALPVPTGAMR
ncbi:MAG: MoxR family ATPase [Acidimicrobiales bacterium]|nr:MoxR family ATPase [Acidimicrobiales bacterium]MCB1250223.1 MoxR family ATPase [Acidimicrobiales bacterium]